MGNAGEKGPVKKQGLEVLMVYFFHFLYIIALPLSLLYGHEESFCFSAIALHCNC